MSDFTAPAFLAPLINLAGLVAKALSLSDEHCADELFMKARTSPRITAPIHICDTHDELIANISECT